MVFLVMVLELVIVLELAMVSELATTVAALISMALSTPAAVSVLHDLLRGPLEIKRLVLEQEEALLRAATRAKRHACSNRLSKKNAQHRGSAIDASRWREETCGDTSPELCIVSW